MVDISSLIEKSFYSGLSLPQQVFRLPYKKFFYNSELIEINRDKFFEKIIYFLSEIQEVNFHLKSIYSVDYLNKNIFLCSFSKKNSIEELNQSLFFENSDINFEFFTFSEIVFITTDNNSLNIVFDRDTEWLIFQPAPQYEKIFKTLYLNDDTLENFRHKTNRNMYENNVAFRGVFQNNPNYIAELKSNYYISDKHKI